MDGGDVSPVNVDLVPNYKTIFADLKDQPYNTFDGVHYGIPHGRGANLLMWNTNDVKPDPTSWSVILDPNQAKKYSGHISVYDDPIYIADAAVYLKAHQPDLGIDNPYELDDDQFNAAVDLLKHQHPYVGDYWSTYLKQINLFTSGDDQVGSTWQYQYFTLLADGQPMKAPGAAPGFVPTEGATGWSDTWMISSDAKHPNCMYKWMNYITSAPCRRRCMQWFGEAPAQSKACEPTRSPLPTRRWVCLRIRSSATTTTQRIRVLEARVLLEHTPCGLRRRPRRRCKDYNDWVSALDRDQGVMSRSTSTAGLRAVEAASSAGSRGGRWAAGSPISSTVALGSRSGRSYRPDRLAGDRVSRAPSPCS